MKTINIFLISVLALGALQISAQGPQNEKLAAEVAAYFDQHIAPVLTAEKGQYLKALSTEHLEALEKIRHSYERESTDPPCMGPGNNMRHHRSGNRPNRGGNGTCLELQSIIQSYPSQNAHYQKVIDSCKTTWKQNLQHMCDQYGLSDTRGKSGHCHLGYGRMDRLSDPRFILLWDADQDALRPMLSRRQHGQKPQRTCCCRPGEGRQQRGWTGGSD